jgi:hypothetical protein
LPGKPIGRRIAPARRRSVYPTVSQPLNDSVREVALCHLTVLEKETGCLTLLTVAPVQNALPTLEWLRSNPIRPARKEWALNSFLEDCGKPIQISDVNVNGYY